MLSPASTNENHQLELPGAWEPPCNSIVEQFDPLETIKKACEMQQLHRISGMANVIVCDCTGDSSSRSGGFAFLWTNRIQVSICSLSLNYIDMHITIGAFPLSFKALGYMAFLMLLGRRKH